MSFITRNISKSVSLCKKTSQQTTSIFNINTTSRLFSTMLTTSTRSPIDHLQKMGSSVTIPETFTTGTSTSTFSSLLTNIGCLLGRRWKSRGNTFQPSTLKRKRRIGFLARCRSKTGQNILKRRKTKGRWYLTY